MKFSFYLCLMLLSYAVSDAQSTDSVIQYRSLEADITEQSAAMTDNRRYEYVPVNMTLGDVAYIVYSSKDYVVALGVRDSAGHEGIKEDDPALFKSIGSKIKLPFKAPASGPYYFVFTSKEPGKTGHFKVSIFYYNNRVNKITNQSSFCDKLKYIAASSVTGFEFLKYKEKQGAINSYFEPSVSLLPAQSIGIFHSSTDSYHCVVEKSGDLEDLKKKYEVLESDIQGCLTDHEKKDFTEETVYGFQKKDFVSMVEFTLAGSPPGDLNIGHILRPVRDKVILQLSKDGADKYRLSLDVE